MSAFRYAPDFRVEINGRPVPAAMRASLASVSCQTALEGADRVELSLVNEKLRWLDHNLLALDNQLALSIGYAPDPLKQVFVGEIVSQAPTFPGSGSPMLTVAAQDRRTHLQQGTQTRWYSVPITSYGNVPVPDMAVASLVAAENLLMPMYDPIGAALSVLIGGVEVVALIASHGTDPAVLQKLIRKQINESNFDFLTRIAHENGWEMTMDHTGARGGWQLHFFSLADHLTPAMALKYGQSLIDFTPRITKVGQIASVTVNFWLSAIKTEFTVTVSWDWDRNSLNLKITPSAGSCDKKSGSKIEDTTTMLVEEPVTKESAPRLLVSKLLSRLNQRLTGSGSTVGDPRIQAGVVLRLEGLGQQFGGLYRVTSATHTIDSGGYRTHFEVRKEIWFGSIPLLEQGAVKLNVQGQTIG
jgi:phage protein D